MQVDKEFHKLLKFQTFKNVKIISTYFIFEGMRKLHFSNFSQFTYIVGRNFETEWAPKSDPNWFTKSMVRMQKGMFYSI